MALRPLTGRTHQLRVHMAHIGTRFAVIENMLVMVRIRAA